jgi:hypothetical protein
MTKSKKHAASIHLDPDLWDRVEQLAQQERRPISQLLRNIVADAVSKSSRGTSAGSSVAAHPCISRPTPSPTARPGKRLQQRSPQRFSPLKTGTDMYGRPELTWRKSEEGWSLHCEGRRGAILHIVRDAVYPGMWRVKRPDVSLSDMANLSWARDGAIAIALGILNHRGADSDMVAA